MTAMTPSLTSASTGTEPKIDAPDSWVYPPLEPLQRAAVNAPEGPLVIAGAPGSGKSRALSARAIALAKGCGHAEWVTILAFNSRTMRTTRSHLDAMVGGPASQAGFCISSIHGLCSQFLRQISSTRLGTQPNFSLWNRSQAHEALSDIIEQANGGRLPPNAPVRNILSWYTKYRNLDQPNNHPPHDASWWEYIEQYTREKRIQNAMDFEDLIAMTIRVLEENPTVRDNWRRQRTRHLLVDEFQDTTPMAYHLFSLLEGPSGSMTIATDPNQAIYEWRGADPNVVFRFIEDHPQAQIHTLELNHRATSNLIEATIAVHSHPMMSGLSPDHQAGIRGPGPEIQYITARSTANTLYDAIAGEIKRLSTQEGIPYSEIGTVYRQHFTRGGLLQALDNAAIPNVILGITNEHRDPDVRSVIAMLTLVANPNNATALAAAADPNIFKQHRRLNPRVATAIRDLANRNNLDLIQAAQALARRMDDNQHARQQLEYVVDMSAYLRDKVDLEQLSPQELVDVAFNRMCQAITGFDSTTPTPAITKLMITAERYHHPVQADARGRLNGFLEYIAQAGDPDLADQDSADPLAHQQGVMVGTIHAAKGLQFNTVFLVDVIDSLIPGPQHESNPLSSAEEQRLFYTAITRATDRLYICWAQHDKHDNPTEASRFLETLRPIQSSQPNS